MGELNKTDKQDAGNRKHNSDQQDSAATSDKPRSNAACQVAQASIAMAQAIAEIHNQYQIGDYSMDQTLWTRESVEAWIKNLSERESILVAVCSPEAQPMGWGIVKSYSDRAGYRVACETSIYMDRQHAGKGVGSILMEQLMSECQRLGYHHVVVKILSDNQPSIDFHLRYGFQLVGIQNEIGLLEGQWKDVAIFQKVFANTGSKGTK